MCSRGFFFGSTGTQGARTVWRRNKKERTRNKRTKSTKEKREGGKTTGGS